MFTGIITAMGAVRRMTRKDEDALLEVTASLDLSDVQIGDSIAVSGVCLTVTALNGYGGITADVSAETLSHTTFKGIRAGDPVNLEKALRLGDRLGGHIVLGHVDGMGKIMERTVRSQSIIFGFEIDPGIDRYIVAKGSIAVDGISLTVNRCEKGRFYVNIIPHTASRTTLGSKRVSDTVNIETDVLAKYVEKLTSVGRGAESTAGGVDLTLLSRYGFLK